MPKIIVLDSAPLGLLCDPRPRPNPLACRQWMADVIAAGHRFVVPEIADYEIRRELLRLGRASSIHALDALAPQTQIEYLPLATSMMRRAAELSGLCRLVVVERPGATTELPEGYDALHLRVPRLEVSSTELRERVRDGRSVRHLVPEAVISLIEEADLYRDRR